MHEPKSMMLAWNVPLRILHWAADKWLPQPDSDPYDIWRSSYSNLAHQNQDLRADVSVRDDLIQALRIDVARGGHR